MSKSWREKVGSVDWKKASQGVSGLSKRVGGQFKDTKFENPIRSVGMKLFLLIFCSILACVLSLGWFSYSKSSSIIQQKVADSSSQTLAFVKVQRQRRGGGHHADASRDRCIARRNLVSKGAHHFGPWANPLDAGGNHGLGELRVL